jgi:hypothetical protein
MHFSPYVVRFPSILETLELQINKRHTYRYTDLSQSYTGMVGSTATKDLGTEIRG